MEEFECCPVSCSRPSLGLSLPCCKAKVRSDRFSSVHTKCLHLPGAGEVKTVGQSQVFQGKVLQGEETLSHPVLFWEQCPLGGLPSGETPGGSEPPVLGIDSGVIEHGTVGTGAAPDHPAWGDHGGPASSGLVVDVTRILEERSQPGPHRSAPLHLRTPGPPDSQHLHELLSTNSQSLDLCVELQMKRALPPGNLRFTGGQQPLDPHQRLSPGLSKGKEVSFQEAFPLIARLRLRPMGLGNEFL